MERSAVASLRRAVARLTTRRFAPRCTRPIESAASDAWRAKSKHPPASQPAEQRRLSRYANAESSKVRRASVLLFTRPSLASSLGRA